MPPTAPDRQYKRCRCPKWLYFVYRGKKHRESARTRSWEKAEKNAPQKEREYEGRELAAKQSIEVKTNVSGPKTIEEAIELYLEDKRQQNCAEETLTNLRTLFRIEA